MKRADIGRAERSELFETNALTSPTVRLRVLHATDHRSPPALISSRSIDITDAAIFIYRNVSNVKQLKQVHHNFPRATGIGPQSRYSPYHSGKVTVRKLNDKDHNSSGSMEDKTSSVSSRMIGGSRPCPADDTIGVRR